MLTFMSKDLLIYNKSFLAVTNDTLIYLDKLQNISTAQCTLTSSEYKVTLLVIVLACASQIVNVS